MVFSNKAILGNIIRSPIFALMDYQMKVMELGYLTFLRDEVEDMSINDFQLLDESAILIIPDMIERGLIHIKDFDEHLHNSVLGISQRGLVYLANGGKEDK